MDTLPEKSSGQQPLILACLLGFFILTLPLLHVTGPAEHHTRHYDLVLAEAGHQRPYLLFQAIPINSAGPEQLLVVPGIGPELSERIVSYRLQHGPFRSLEDLVQVPGIGPKKLKNLQAYCRL